MELPDISRLPKAAWLGILGVTGGAVAIKVWKNRANDGSTDQAATEVAAPGLDGSLVAATDYPITGTAPLISPVVLTGNTESGSGTDTGALQSLYLDGVSGLLGAYENVVGPMQSTQQALLLNQNDALLAIAGAGGSPAGVASPVVSAPPPPTPTATAIPTGATDPVVNRTTDRVNRDIGKKGAARSVWCAERTINIHKSGRRVVTGERKIKNGKC